MKGGKGGWRRKKKGNKKQKILGPTRIGHFEIGVLII